MFDDPFNPKFNQANFVNGVYDFFIQNSHYIFIFIIVVTFDQNNDNF